MSATKTAKLINVSLSRNNKFTSRRKCRYGWIGRCLLAYSVLTLYMSYNPKEEPSEADLSLLSFFLLGYV